MSRFVLFSLFLFVLNLEFCVGKYVSGTIDTTSTGENWMFISRFCFVTKKGELTYSFVYPKKYAPQSILLYYDEADQWQTVYKTNTNCSVKYSALSIQNHQVIQLDDSEDYAASSSGCKLQDNNGYKYYNCSGRRTFRSSRERWWFIALSRCENKVGQPNGLKVDYNMHLTNGEPDELLTYEFSADEFYILPVDIAFLFGYLLMVVLSIVVAVHLKNKQLFHTTYKMYIVSLGLWTFHLLLLSIAYGRYGDSGFPQPKTVLTARIIGAASILVFLLMLILMAKGYTITRGRLSQQGAIKITVFMCIYIVVYVVLFIWEAELFDPGKVLYLYDSPPGYGLVAMRLIGWLWFLYANFFTLKNYPSKGAFYYPFFIFYTIWFWAGPIIIMVAQHALELWVREKTVNGVEMLIALLGHLFFLVLTRPGAANGNFPYHVRTSQIAAMTNGPEQQASTHDSRNNEFQEYPYSVSSNNMVNGTGPDLTGLFVVSQTRTEPTEKSLPVTSTNNFINGSDSIRTPVFQGRLPPLSNAPPSYEALFTVGGSSTTR